MSAPPITERHLPHFHRRAPAKEPVRAVVTSNVTIATALNAGDSAGGVTLAAGDRVLLTAQSTGSQNGIYVAGVTPVRAYDFDTGDAGIGWTVLVREGTGAGTTYYNTNTGAITVGSTAVTFATVTSGVTDHGALTGLGDDDHPQYTTDAESAVIAAAAVAPHLADTSDAHDASAISILDAGGLYTGTDVEAALQEIRARLWVPVMVEDGATGLWYVAVTGDGDAVMTEVPA